MRTLLSLSFLLCLCAYSCQPQTYDSPTLLPAEETEEVSYLLGFVGGFNSQNFYLWRDGTIYEDVYKPEPGRGPKPGVPYETKEAFDIEHWQLLNNSDRTEDITALIQDFPTAEILSSAPAGSHCEAWTWDGLCPFIGVYNAQSRSYQWYHGEYPQHKELAQYMQRVLDMVTTP